MTTETEKHVDENSFCWEFSCIKLLRMFAERVGGKKPDKGQSSHI